MYQKEIVNHKIDDEYVKVLKSIKGTNEIMPRLSTANVNMDTQHLGEYKVYNKFLEVATLPLKNEIERLNSSILDIYNSRRWKLVSRIINTKSHIAKLPRRAINTNLFKVKKTK